MISGDFCSQNKVILLEFSLKSDKLGEATQKLQISILKINSDKTESSSLTFNKDAEKLKVRKIKIN